MPKKFLDANGITHLVSLLDNYPDNTILSTVIDSIDEQKQDLLTFDNVPIENSQNPVTSNGIWKETAQLYNTKIYGPDSLISFEGKVKDFPLKSCLINIEPVQAGSGDSSPENVRAISGWTGVTVQQTGKNMYSFGGSASESRNGITFTRNVDGTVQVTGTATDATFYIFTALQDGLPEGDYILSGSSGDAKIYGVYNEEYYWDNTGDGVSIHYTGGKLNFNIRVLKDKTVNNIVKPMLRIASDTSPEFEPYRRTIYSMSWQSETGIVYGGMLDVTGGVLTVTHGRIVYDGSETWTTLGDGYYRQLPNMRLGLNNHDSMCDVFPFVAGTNTPGIQLGYGGNSSPYVYIRQAQTLTGAASAAELRAWLAEHPVEVVYPLAEPVTYQITPQEVVTLAGLNYIWADCGNVTVEYGAFLETTQKKIDFLQNNYSSHTHSVSDITSGVLPIANGGTGNNTGYITAGQKSGTTLGVKATAEGNNTTASNSYSHAEGNGTIASNNASHAEGYQTTASGQMSHAEGFWATASGNISHVEGYSTTASGDYSHAEGQETTASGDYSHTEGLNTTAGGVVSHAEGFITTANGDFSHAEGFGTIANYRSQHVFGEYNIEDDFSDSETSRGNYIEIVGNGSGENHCSNARTLDWDGNEVLAGRLTVGENPFNNMDVATKQYVDNKVITINNHYTPADTSAALAVNATGATAAWSIDVVKGITLNKDAKGHVTGLSVTSGKIPANPNTDTKVNVTLATTTKAYLLGTSTTPTSTAAGVTALADTGVYLDTTAGKLTATSFAGSGANLTSLNGSNISSGTVAFARLPTIYWANIAVASSATYNKTPELAKIKLNGNTSASVASSSNVELIYDSTNEVLNFVFN